MKIGFEIEGDRYAGTPTLFCKHQNSVIYQMPRFTKLTMQP